MKQIHKLWWYNKLDMDNQPTAPAQAPQPAPRFSYVNETFQQAPGNNSNKLFRWLPKILLGVFGLVIAYELFLAVKTFTAPVATPAKVLPLSGAKISLLSEKKDLTGKYLQSTIYKVGDGILVNVRLDTGGHTTDAVDAVIKYDANLLEATGSGIVKGASFDDYPLARVDNQKGEVRISAITGSEQNGFNGASILATLLLRAKASGEAKLNIVFEKGATDDSNVIEVKSTDDILEVVNDLSLTITN